MTSAEVLEHRDTRQLPPAASIDGDSCTAINELLSRVGDTWSMQTVRRLGDGPMRFNALRRAIGTISRLARPRWVATDDLSQLVAGSAEATAARRGSSSASPTKV